MKSYHDLRDILARIDARQYKAYADIAGAYRFPRFDLYIDYVQGDPYAQPSRMRVRVDRSASGFTTDMTETDSRRIALCDYLIRRFHLGCRTLCSKKRRGTGKGGLIAIAAPGQEILERSAMLVDAHVAEARFRMGLPALFRKVSSPDAVAMFFDELPAIVDHALYFDPVDRQSLYRHIETAEDADAARTLLEKKGLAGFVADGSRLPRASGIDPKPSADDNVVPFTSPNTLRVTLHLPNSGRITGMGIPKGITLITGGGYHGKSTLLSALELGIYNHVPGDGREMVVCPENTMKIRACDGRNIEKTDVSAFIGNLPFKQDTAAFSTANASGSTSQAANIAEAIEAGARVLLLDEDTSATNFMIRDRRMQQLISKDLEPITPFADTVNRIYAEKDISTILVMGGSGDYFSVADHVIAMNAYRPEDVTARAHEIAAADPAPRVREGRASFGVTRRRVPAADSCDPYGAPGKIKISARGRNEILFGKSIIDLSDLEQLVDISQTGALGYALWHAVRYMDGRRTVPEVADAVLSDIEKQGLDAISPHIMGELARFRALDLAAAMNRMRTLRITRNTM